MTKLEKWQAEAAAQGWTFVSQADKDYATYTHSACGCNHKMRICDMRVGQVRCQHCMEQAWRNDAIAQGWTFVSKVNALHGNYIHNACGHEQQVQPGHIRGGRVRCEHCLHQTWSNEAAAQGWTFVAKTDAHYGNYIHCACGHKQTITLGNMRKGGVQCLFCKTAKLKAEALKHGWTFVAQVDSEYANYTHNACGQNQHVHLNAMRAGRVACHGCGESWATKPSNLYLLDITTACGQRFLKLGMARIVDRRAARYGLADGAKIKVLYTKAYATGAEACKVEKKLHKTATKIHPSIRKFKGAKKLMDSGYTECYEYSPEAVNYLLFTLQF